jgi:hypothetical protein
LARRRRAGAAAARRPAPPRAAPARETAPDEPIVASNLSLHDLFQQQIRAMLDRTDLDAEQKEEILVAAACPCCGAGGMSLSVKLKRRS